jgi:ABC-type multidrug transport system fused ATPase/permease subunit
MNPVKRIIYLSNIYREYVGIRRMCLLFSLQTTVAFAEGIGITLLLPLLTSLDISSRPAAGVSLYMYNALEFIDAESSVLAIILIIGLVFICKGILIFAEKGYQGYLQSILMKELKYKFNAATIRMDYSYYTKMNTGHFVNIMNDQMTKFYLSFKGYINLFTCSIMGLSYFFFGLLISWEFVLLSTLSGVFILMSFRVLNKYLRNISRKSAYEMSNLNKILVQCIHSFKYIVSTSKEENMAIEVKRSVVTLTNLLFKESLANAFTSSIKEPLAIMFIIGIVLIQIKFLEGNIAPIIVSVLFFYRAIGNVLNIQSSWQGLMGVMGSVELVTNEFKMLEQNKVKEGNTILKNFSKMIELKNVSFSYEKGDNAVFENINIKIPAYKTIAILGESGVGKSTLVDLLTLLLKPQSGVIVIDGVNAHEVKLNSWRKQIGYVSQEPMVFDDTITNNISMWTGNPDTDPLQLQRVKYAAKQANIENFIENLPNGYDTQVGDRGIRLSGGQRQRLCVARELFKEPLLLILDEATSALDTESENYIKDSIEALKGKITVVQIAHRLSTIRNADYVYILRERKVVEEGTYMELASKSGSILVELLEQQNL